MVALEVMPSVPDTTAKKAAINIEKVSKTFGDRLVLKDVDCTIGEEEFVSIIGPSGCGKSTILRLISGLVPFEKGSLHLQDKPVTGPSEDVSFVFQTSNLLPWLNVRANLLLGANLDSTTEKPSDEAVTEMIETLGLTGFEEAYPHQLSGGMRHRVAVGQALIRSPKVMLMDEPFGALDALTRDRLNMELLDIWQHQKKTVVMVTHSIAEAILLSDRVLVISARPGTVVEDIRIDLPRPRDPSETRKSTRFGDYVVQLSRLMGIE